MQTMCLIALSLSDRSWGMRRYKQTSSRSTVLLFISTSYLRLQYVYTVMDKIHAAHDFPHTGLAILPFLLQRALLGLFFH